MKLDKLYEQKPVYEAIISDLQDAASDEVYLSPEVFMPVLRKALAKVTDDKKLLDKIADGLSVMDKNAEIQRDKHGAILYDKASKDTEFVPYEESIDDYMAREVLPHVPDAKAFWEEKADAKKACYQDGRRDSLHAVFLQVRAACTQRGIGKAVHGIGTVCQPAHCEAVRVRWWNYA